jgi:hypothetical protein
VGSLVIRLTRVDTLKPIVLDLPSEEGGYPKDVFTAGDLPGGRFSKLYLEWSPGLCVVAIRTDRDARRHVCGVIPESAVVCMRVPDDKELQSHLNSL